MPTTSDEASDRLPRRNYLQALGLAVGTGLAGCSAQDDGDDSANGTDEPGGDDGNDSSGSAGQTGERVPTLTIEYWTDASGTPVFENTLPTVQSNLEDLGVSTRVVPKSLSDSIGGVFNDSREAHFYPIHPSLPSYRLDPHDQVSRFYIMWAGANGKANLNNFANCEYSREALKQASATNEEDRIEATHNALRIFSEEIGMINIHPVTKFGAYNPQQVEVSNLGQAGIQNTGYRSLINSTATGASQLIFNSEPPTFEDVGAYKQINSGSISIWQHLFFSPLMEYDENFELVPMMAADYEISNEAKTFTFDLRDATFHDGEPVTAEDVKFTFEWISENAGTFPSAQTVNYNSIEAIDDSTVEFNLDQSFLPFLNRVVVQWGIAPKHAFEAAGADENPESFSMSPIVGSGPYQVANFQQGQFIQGEPHDGHPQFEPDSNITIQAFQDIQSAKRAFDDGQINMIGNLPFSLANQIEEGSTAKVVPTEGFLPYAINPIHSFGPQKDREFRHAVSQALDRNRITQNTIGGFADPQLTSSVFTASHPWNPPEKELTQIADSPGSNLDRAREILENEGWSFDSNGRLHYPADFDQSPVWPEGEEPADHPDQFPCVSELPPDF